MSIIENHILSIVNNNDGIIDFCENYLEHDEDFNEYLEEIEFDANYDFSEYQYDYNLYKYEIMNELYGDHIKEQFFNNVIRAFIYDELTDADKHIMLKYLVTEAAKPNCDISVKHVLDDYANDSWESLICSYVFIKVNNMIFNEKDGLQDCVIGKIEDWIRDKLRERTIRNIAISKIKRNEIFNLGLGLKLSMRDCGIPVGA
ncbi:hypothetical protein CpVVM_02 [Chrysochromulina parva virophage Moe]|nr:hypothetical protein CpVVM_02 [Chrysochromulina parva virophage Moe]